MDLTIIKNSMFLNEDMELINGNVIVIRNGVIHSIISDEPNCFPNKVIDANNLLIVPSFINSHYHLGETIYRSFADTSSLENYLAFTENASQFLNSESHHNIAIISLIEAIKSGTSVISCARGWNAVQQIGIRGNLGYPLMKSTKLKQFYNDFDHFYINKSKKFPIVFQTGNIQIILGLWIHSLEYIDNDVLKKISKIYNSNSETYLSIHVSETKKQVINNFKKYGMTEIEVLDKYGLLAEKTNIVHANYINNNDFDLIANKKANITICPVSNKILNTRLPNLPILQSLGINISIGTDGLATSYSASILEHATFTYLFYREFNINSNQLFKMITLNPAKTIGFKNSGAIKIGFVADFNFFDLNDSRLYPLDNAISNILFNNIRPIHVMVDGKFVMKDRKLININEREAINLFCSIRKKIGGFYL